MQALSRSIAVLSLCLLPLAAIAAPASGTADIVAHLGTTDGENGRTHVHVQLNRTDVTDVTVELFDAEGVSLHTYALKPRQDGTYRPTMTVDIAPVLAPKVATARVTAFTISSAEREALFDTGLIKRQSDHCFEACEFTRWDCNTYCWCKGCTSTTYSCDDVNGDCVATCTCGGCIGEPTC